MPIPACIRELPIDCFRAACSVNGHTKHLPQPLSLSLCLDLNLNHENTQIFQLRQQLDDLAFHLLGELTVDTEAEKLNRVSCRH